MAAATLLTIAASGLTPVSFASAQAVGAETGSGAPARTVRWLAAGDSYSAGEGLPHNDGTDCQRANGQNGQSSLAWAMVAGRSIKGGPLKVDGDTPTLVACSGATTEEFFTPLSALRQQWSVDRGRYDLVSFTFGGNDLHFDDILYHCLGIDAAGLSGLLAAEAAGGLQDPLSATAAWTADPLIHCPPEGPTHATIDSAKFKSDYATFLTRVATDAVTPGGNIVVLGYPDLLEDPALWPTVNRVLGLCHGIRAADARELRGLAGTLNATIGTVVHEVNAIHPHGVHVTFVDVNTGHARPDKSDPATVVGLADPNLFEPNTGARHNICATPEWLNGLSHIHLGKGSFHPNQSGQIAMGNLMAEVIPHLHWSGLAGNGAARLAIATGSGMQIWSAATGTVPYGTPTGPAVAIHDVAWSIDGRYLAWQRSTPDRTLLELVDTVTGLNKLWPVPGDGLGAVVVKDNAVYAIEPAGIVRFNGSGSTTVAGLPPGSGVAFGEGPLSPAAYGAGWVTSSWDALTSSPVSNERVGLDGLLPGGYAVAPAPGTGSPYEMSAVDPSGRYLALEQGDHTDVCGVGPGSILWTIDLSTGKTDHNAPPTLAAAGTLRFLSMAWGPNHTVDVTAFECDLSGSPTPKSFVPVLWEHTDTGWAQIAAHVLGGGRGPAGQLATITGDLEVRVGNYPTVGPGGTQQVTVNGTAIPTSDPVSSVSWAPDPATITATATTKAPPAIPVLGRSWAPDQQGYGTVQPTTIFNGGDPTGLVTNVHWLSWGASQATATGTGEYVGPNQIVADGTQETATVVAFDLGTCQGKLAYQGIEWFFPQHGETFNPKQYINMCTGSYVGA